MQARSRSTAADSLLTSPLLLTDGAIETLLIYEFRLPLPDFASFVALFDPLGRRALEKIYRSYLEVAAEFNLSMHIGIPTWRAHPEEIARQDITDAGAL